MTGLTNFGGEANVRERVLWLRLFSLQSCRTARGRPPGGVLVVAYREKVVRSLFCVGLQGQRSLSRLFCVGLQGQRSLGRLFCVGLQGQRSLGRLFCVGLQGKRSLSSLFCVGLQGHMLAALRIARGVSQRDLAGRLGVHESQVSRDKRNEYQVSSSSAPAVCSTRSAYSSRAFSRGWSSPPVTRLGL